MSVKDKRQLRLNENIRELRLKNDDGRLFVSLVVRKRWILVGNEIWLESSIHVKLTPLLCAGMCSF